MVVCWHIATKARCLDRVHNRTTRQTIHISNHVVDKQFQSIREQANGWMGYLLSKCNKGCFQQTRHANVRAVLCAEKCHVIAACQIANNIQFAKLHQREPFKSHTKHINRNVGTVRID